MDCAPTPKSHRICALTLNLPYPDGAVMKLPTAARTAAPPA